MARDDAHEPAADLRIGPTSTGLVRLLVSSSGGDVPMDFEPGEAEEIAEEMRAAAASARRGS